MIDRILCVCQTKVESLKWVEHLKQQIKTSRQSSTLSATTTNPPPPPHVSLYQQPFELLTSWIREKLVNGSLTVHGLRNLTLSSELYSTEFRRDNADHREESLERVLRRKPNKRPNLPPEKRKALNTNTFVISHPESDGPFESIHVESNGVKLVEDDEDVLTFAVENSKFSDDVSLVDISSSKDPVESVEERDFNPPGNPFTTQDSCDESEEFGCQENMGPWGKKFPEYSAVSSNQNPISLNLDNNTVGVDRKFRSLESAREFETLKLFDINQPRISFIDSSCSDSSSFRAPFLPPIKYNRLDFNFLPTSNIVKEPFPIDHLSLASSSTFGEDFKVREQRSPTPEREVVSTTMSSASDLIETDNISFTTSNSTSLSDASDSTLTEEDQVQVETPDLLRNVPKDLPNYSPSITYTERRPVRPIEPQQEMVYEVPQDRPRMVPIRMMDYSQPMLPSCCAVPKLTKMPQKQQTVCCSKAPNLLSCASSNYQQNHDNICHSKTPQLLSCASTKSQQNQRDICCSKTPEFLSCASSNTQQNQRDVCCSKTPHCLSCTSSKPQQKQSNVGCSKTPQLFSCPSSNTQQNQRDVCCSKTPRLLSCAPLNRRKNHLQNTDDVYGFTPNWPLDNDEYMNLQTSSLSRDDCQLEDSNQLKVLPPFHSVLLTDTTSSQTFTETSVYRHQTYYPVIREEISFVRVQRQLRYEPSRDSHGCLSTLV